MADTDNQPQATAPSDEPVMDQIYGKLKQVLGGTNPNQFFTMTVPGTILNQSDFSYDTTKGKPALVTEAESRLVDQMFDIAPISGGNNGQRVSSQYLQALSVLVPRFNPVMPAMKNRLREFLASPAPPDATVEGEAFTGTIQELYFALYESWLVKKADWERLVVGKRNTLSPEKYLEWYEEVAEARLALIDAAEGRLLAVFSRSDMDAILGALACGPGGELQEAAAQVLDMRLPSPSGGFIYPVDLSPSNWFLGLASDQDPVDLLHDPEFIALTLSGRRQALRATISQVQDLIKGMPTAGAITEAASALNTAQTDYTTAQNDLIKQYSANTITGVEMYLAATTGAGEAAGGLDELNGFVGKVGKAANGTDGEKAQVKDESGTGLRPLAGDNPMDLQKLLDGQNNVIEAQSRLTTSAQRVADASMDLASKQALTFPELPGMLARLQSQLDDITALQSQLAIAIQRPVPADAGSGAASDSGHPSGGTHPRRSRAADRWMDLQFECSTTSMTTRSTQASQSQQASFHVDLFFGSASGQTSSASSDFTQHALSSDARIKIGMKATKVDISRGWFEPGLFKLSRDMHRLADVSVSTGWQDLTKLKDGANDAILPCFPVSFVIVKDVTIEFETAESQTDAVKSVLDSRSAVGGGFLCFSASGASAGHRESSALSTRTEEQTVRINMPGPQILGWFCEFTPEDKSTKLIHPESGTTTAGQELDIIQFVDALQRFDSTDTRPAAPAAPTP